MTMFVPPDHKLIRVVRSLEYASQTHAAGQLLVVDVHTAERLVAAKSAELIDLGPRCPQCSAPADPALSTRVWAACHNWHGWKL